MDAVNRYIGIELVKFRDVGFVGFNGGGIDILGVDAKLERRLGKRGACGQAHDQCQRQGQELFHGIASFSYWGAFLC